MPDTSLHPLSQLFEKQTVSPGIQALRLLGDILDRGTFVIRAGESAPMGTPQGRGGGSGCGQLSFSLSLDLLTEGESDKGFSTETKEELLGLRARLAIMEVPPNEEIRWTKDRGHGVQAAVEGLNRQLQV